MAFTLNKIFTNKITNNNKIINKTEIKIVLYNKY